jgi:hypothetical protein
VEKKKMINEWKNKYERKIRVVDCNVRKVICDEGSEI